MCAEHRDFGSVSHSTDRAHLAAFILPSSVAGSQGPASKPRDSRDLRQNAARVIAVDPPIAPVQTCRLVAHSLQKSCGDLAIHLRKAPAVWERSDE
jgi:hypothetical protein